MYDTSGWDIDQSTFVKADHVKKHTAGWFGASSSTEKEQSVATAATTADAAAGSGTGGNGGGVSSSSGEADGRPARSDVSSVDSVSARINSNADSPFFRIEMDPFSSSPRKSESWKNKKRGAGEDSSLEEWLFK
jgi:hypothetical protein